MKYNTIYDGELNSLSSLTWLPWVGNNYDTPQGRFLIVGESHYYNAEDDVESQRNEVLANKYFTREVIKECPIENDWENKTFSNLHACLSGSYGQKFDKIWEYFSFYNFIQRPMQYNSKTKERPRNEDWLSAWWVFLDVCHVLRPKACLFIGTTAANFFENAMNTFSISHSEMKYMELTNNAYPKKTSFSLDERYKDIPIFFIKHTSCFFSYENWHTLIKRVFPDLVNNINSHFKLEDNFIDTRNIKINESEEKNRIHTKDIPTWLMHRPIIAAPYDKISWNDETSDAKYVSIGHATYDNEDLSVKIFRTTGSGRWSRQSEEVPIYRVGYMMQLLLTSIKYAQDKTTQTRMNEEIISEDEMKFLKQNLKSHGMQIKQSIKEIRRLIDEIDIDNI